MPPPPPSFQPTTLGPLSSQSIPDALWSCINVQLGAGVLIIQPETRKTVVISEDYKEYVPTGRKVRRKVEVNEAYSPASLELDNATPNESPIAHMNASGSNKRGIMRGFNDISLGNWWGLHHTSIPELPDEIEEDELQEITKTRWFLPKGRKDVGESLEETAVREGYEEVCICTHAI